MTRLDNGFATAADDKVMFCCISSCPLSLFPYTYPVLEVVKSSSTSHREGEEWKP